MDDSKRPRAAFPFGDYEVIAYRPTEGQALSLSLTRPGKTSEENAAAVQRILRVLERLIGAEAWQRIDDGMIDGDISFEDVTTLLSAIISFDWDGDGDPVSSEALRTAVAEAVPEPPLAPLAPLAPRAPRRV